jgi:hypothetical protein
MSNRNSAIIAFLAGAAAGAIVTYIICSNQGEEVVDNFKDLAQKVRDNIAEQLSNLQGKKSTTEQDDMMGV